MKYTKETYWEKDGNRVTLEELEPYLGGIETEDVDDLFDNCIFNTDDAYYKSKEIKDKILSDALKTDLSFPIILLGDKILDGNHRLLKAYYIGYIDIMVRKVQIDKLPTVIYNIFF